MSGSTIWTRHRRLQNINAEMLSALKLAQELLERNGIERPEINAAIAKAEATS